MSEAETHLSELTERAGSRCDLCSGADDLRAHAVEPGRGRGADDLVLLCTSCRARLGPDTELDANHWFCLQESAWSGESVVQALSWRLLQRLQSEGWAQDLLGMLYLDDAVLAWAQSGDDPKGDDDSPPTLDSNGNRLSNGDSVTLIKGLDVKGTSFVAKRGTMVRNIRLIAGDPANIEGRVNKIALVLKTCFLKRAN
jgi:protein PhnA